MKIAFLHMNMGLVERGSEVSTQLLANQLSISHQVLVLQAGMTTQQNYQSIRVFRLRKSFNAAPTNVLEKILFRLYLDPHSQMVKKFTQKSLPYLIKFNPDIIIPVNGAPQINILKNNLPGKKIVVFGRAGIGYHDKDSLKGKPDLFIALSARAKTWAKKIASPKTKVVYLPNPIDIRPYQKAPKVKIDLELPIVLSVAALSSYKNIDLVIKAVAQTPYSLLIVGKGEEEHNLKILAKKLLPGRHKFITVSHADLPSYYKSADVFCLVPDQQEAFGRVYIEAMASGLPIVATRDSIRKKIIGSNGLFASLSVENISKMLKLAMGTKPINYTEELSHYNLSNVCGKLETYLAD